MSFGNTMYALSNVNAVLGSLNSSIQAKNNGATAYEAASNFNTGLMFGLVRNAAAKNIFDYSGSSLGYTVNTLAGYGTPEADARGASGLLGASLLTSPFGLFGGGCCHRNYSMMPFYGGGIWGGSFFGAPHCHHHHSPFLSERTTFVTTKYYC